MGTNSPEPVHMDRVLFHADHFSVLVQHIRAAELSFPDENFWQTSKLSNSPEVCRSEIREAWVERLLEFVNGMSVVLFFL